MQIMDMIASSGALGSMARDLGISQGEARRGAEALLPAVLGGFKKQAQGSGGGMGALGSILGNFGGGGLLDEIIAPKPTDPSRGNDVLGQIFGSKDVSRTVAASASERSGLDPSILKKMLPILAMAVAGFMSKQSGETTTPRSSGGLGGLLGGGSGGGLMSMLDFDGDGNPLDDILSMAGKR